MCFLITIAHNYSYIHNVIFKNSCMIRHQGEHYLLSSCFVQQQQQVMYSLMMSQVWSETRKSLISLKYYCESYDNCVHLLVKISEKGDFSLMALW